MAKSATRVLDTELHLHLRGAMPVDLFSQWISRCPVEIALDQAPIGHLQFFARFEHLKAFLHPDQHPPAERLFEYDSFDGFLASYLFSSYFCRSIDDFRALVQAVQRDLAAQGIGYAEITVSVPEYLMHGLPLEGIVEVLSEAAQEKDPTTRWIIDFVRNFGPEPAMRLLGRLLANRPEGWVGVTLGGAEHNFPPGPFKDVYAKAKAEGLGLTVHAGEAAGPESVWEALRELRVDRIGHGVRAVEDPALIAHLADKGIPLEVCPTSNVRTGVYPTMAEHPVARLHEAGIRLSLNTDDPTFFATTLEKEFEAAKTLGLGEQALDDIAAAARRQAFQS